MFPTGFAPGSQSWENGWTRSGTIRGRYVGVFFPCPVVSKRRGRVSRAYDGDLQMVDSSSIRVHQHAANIQKRMRGAAGNVAAAARVAG
jgi:hypothetical protein